MKTINICLLIALVVMASFIQTYAIPVETADTAAETLDRTKKHWGFGPHYHPGWGMGHHHHGWGMGHHHHHHGHHHHK